MAGGGLAIAAEINAETGQALVLRYCCRAVVVEWMARKPSVHIPGGVYHVMLRGNEGEDILLVGEDRYRWYVLAQEGVGRYGHRIHGFCRGRPPLVTGHIPAPKTAF